MKRLTPSLIYLSFASWYLYPCPAGGGDLDGTAFRYRATDGPGETDREVGPVVRAAGSKNEPSPRFLCSRDNTAVHASDLIDTAGHEHTPLVVAAGLDVLLN